MRRRIIQGFFTLPTTENGSTPRTAPQLYVIAWLGFVLTIGYSLVYVLVTPQYWYRTVFFALPMLVVCGITMRLIHMRRVQMAGGILHGGSWVLLTLVVASSGGTRAPFFALYTLLVMHAALFSGWRTAVFFAVLTVLGGLVMVYLANQGLIPEPFATPLGALATQAVIMIVVSTDAYIVVRDIQQALRRAHQELAERQRAETALRESETRYRVTSELISDYAFAYDVNPDGSLTPNWATEDSFTRLTGYSWREIGATFMAFHPEDAVKAQSDVQKTVRGQSTAAEYRIITKDGQLRWLYVHRRPLWSETEQRVVRVYGVAQDITERKQAEDALRRSEALLRALLDATQDVAFLMSPDGTFLIANKATGDSMGSTVEALSGKNGFDMMKPELRAQRVPRFEEVRQSGKPVRFEDFGFIGWSDNSIYPVFSPSGAVEAFAVYSRDINEQKRLQAELQRYTQQLEQVVEERTAQLRSAKAQIEIVLNNTYDAFALTEKNGDIQTKNPAFVSMFGDQVSQAIEHILWIVVDVEQTVPVGSALLKAIYDRQLQRLEVQIRRDGGRDRDIDLVFIPVQLADEGERSGLLVSAHDITHLKEMERFKARFVADAVHDLATPIAGLNTRLYLLKRTPEAIDEHIRALENQVGHLRGLLADLRTLSESDRGQLALELEVCDVRRLVRRVFDTYEPVAIGKQQTLELVIDPALPEARLDSHQIERVLVNLVSNAINYTPGGKTIRLGASLEGDTVLFSVADEGIGISAEDLPHVFERFYRTGQARKTRSSGTGLGLAIVKEIVEIHGGTVAVTSEPGRGSTFTARLPLRQ